jgi:hypothetical protein
MRGDHQPLAVAPRLDDWMHFDNIGSGRRTTTSTAPGVIQVGTTARPAYYADGFVDSSGLRLGGGFACTTEFPKNELPEYERF